MTKPTGVAEIKRFFESGNYGRKVTVQELKTLKENDKDFREIRQLCQKD